MPLKDRGDLKWQGFIMPEQAAHIAEARAQLEREPKPYVDAELAASFSARLTPGSDVTIKRWHDGKTSVIEGKVVRQKAAQGYFELETAGTITRIKFDDLLYVD